MRVGPMRANPAHPGAPVLALGLAVIGASLGGCERDPTQLVVVVGSDLPPEALERVRTAAARFGGQPVDLEEPWVVWGDGSALGEPSVRVPFSFAVVPYDGDAKARVRIEVSGLDASGATTVSQTALVGFVENERLLVPIFLSSACRNFLCPAGETCRAYEGVPRCEAEAIPELDPVRPTDELDGAVASPPADAGPLDAGPLDAGPPRVACPWDDGPPDFDDPERLPGLETGIHLHPRLSWDGLRLTFAWKPSASEPHTMFVSERATPTSPFGEPQPIDTGPLSEVTNYTESVDGTFIAIAAELTPGDADIFQLTSAGSEAIPLRIDEVSNAGDSEWDPFLTYDGTELFFSRTVVGGSQAQILRARRDPTTNRFEAPTPLPEINGGISQSNPSLTADGTILLFNWWAEDEMDLWFAVRESPAMPFGPPERLVELSQGPMIFDEGPSISADGCEVFLSRSDGLWVARATR